MKTHPFESITEEQWKSGLSRHKCALCSFDYDDPVHGVSYWPLVIAIEDCFVPQSAENVITACAELDSQTITTSWELIAMNAREEIGVN